MKKLPSHDPKVIWGWGVCQRYRNLDDLERVTGGRPQLDAKDVLGLPVRAVDQVWVLMRPEVLPPEVFDRVHERIVAVLPDDPSALPDETSRERAALIGECRRANDYWGVSRHTAAVVERLGKRTLAAEYERQLTILREEIEAWLQG